MNNKLLDELLELCIDRSDYKTAYFMELRPTRNIVIITADRATSRESRKFFGIQDAITYMRGIHV